VSNNSQDQQGGDLPHTSWNEAPITPPRQLGDGKFPPKVFYWKAHERSDAWVKEHNPYPVGTTDWDFWAALVHLDQLAGAATWKRSNVHRVFVVWMFVALGLAVLAFFLSLFGVIA
jgi:hypothetical protein